MNNNFNGEKTISDTKGKESEESNSGGNCKIKTFCNLN